MMKPDIERLRHFTALTDRQLTSDFAGRETELDLIHTRVGTIAQRAFKEHSIMPAEGQTLLITGAPGAGKTALACKAGQQLEEEGGGIFLPLELRALADQTRFQRQFEKQVPPDRLRMILEK